MQERKSERVEEIFQDGQGDISLYDLSNTGISCYHNKKKEKGSFVSIRINKFLFKAKVVYCKKHENRFRLGLQFWNILPERQAKLNALVESYSKGVPVKCSIVDDKK